MLSVPIREKLEQTEKTEFMGGKETVEYEEYIRMGLDAEAPLKLILCGSVEETGKEKTGVVSVVYATCDKRKAEKKLRELIQINPENYYMVYSVPRDVELPTLTHYPSIEITREDLA